MKKTEAHTRYKNKAGETIPGCTTIINSNLGWNKQVLMAWARKEAMAGRDPSKVSADAASKGTLAHYLIECHIKGIEQDKDYLSQFSAQDLDAAETSYISFLDWDKATGIKFVQSEAKYVSELYQFGCTIDSIGKSGSDLVIIDFKTGKDTYTEYILQLAANSRAYEETTGETIRGWYSLVVNRETGSFKYKRYTDTEIDLGWQAFKNCLDLYKIQKELER